MLKLEDISHEYAQGDSNIKVLKNLRLDVSRSNNLGIIGPSGSGKTTLLNIIGLVESPKNGKILINNFDCNSMKIEEKTNFRKDNIGFIFQNNQLLEDFNVLENIALPLILNGVSLNKSLKEAENFLKLLNLENRKNFKPGLLSGGEQQRIAVARALIKKPLILLADEPTGSLDSKTSQDVFNFMIQMAKKNNTICIIATHNMNLIKKLDLCYKIEEGKLIEFN
ncbi:MAG: hypothetical protein CMP34_01275 [Rickettsiales bacterium]|nr:hypothetical protein [Rickettsiales bacterium]|tara:strand:- start:1755 stop:2426 length:672 start_codon:yes stop_codon:yes gene_type:complete